MVVEETEVIIYDDFPFVVSTVLSVSVLSS